MTTVLFRIDNVEHEFSVEFTPRGGHLITVVGLTWSGLYRFDEGLCLFARCHGTPPAAIEVSSSLSQSLMQLLGSNP